MFTVFHHDGPFDALNPRRNRNNSRRAPMQAFPEGSLNNSIGGSGPVNRQPDHATFLGQGNDEAFQDFAGGRPGGSSKNPAIFDPVARGAMVHGEESVGLGTSTFLEGTPAARTAIVQQEQEAVDTGLQRKKSLAHRIRHMNKGPREFQPSGRITSPDSLRSPDGAGDSSPFFSEYAKGEDSISVRPRDGAMSPTSPPAGRPQGSRIGAPLERRATTDAAMTVDEASASKPSGILGRMKSLKGGRKGRSDSNGEKSPPAYPGTAV